MGPGMALEEQDLGLVSAVARVESGVEAEPGVGLGGQVRVGVCGTTSVVVAVVLARPEAAVRPVRVEEPGQGAAKAVGAAVAQAPAGAAVPVVDLVGPVEGPEAVGVRERAFLENG